MSVYNAKKYLNRLRYLNLLIKSKKEQLAEVKNKAESICSPSLRERVQTSPKNDCIESSLSAVMELENEIQIDVEKYLKIQLEISQAISRIENYDERTLLELRYINLKKWEEIAVDMNYSYRQTLRLHGRALLSFERWHTMSH
ncbi:MAG: DUF1492 domain-containing protein [Clostridia bacterium]|nr:DUF1492 domain-containing protein [Clostridia bacterium]